MASFLITDVSASEQPEVSDAIETELLRSLAEVNLQSENESVCIIARNDAGERIGGVTGSTSYGWLLVKMLWVCETCRGQRIARDLMATAKERARGLQCHSAWLDTTNTQAREFYLNLGYEDFGVLQNGPERTPEDHCRWYMKKLL